MKNKNTTILLSLFLGGLGMHRFYLGQHFRGIIYLLFSWTLIPIVIGIIDSIVFIIMKENTFNEKYNSKKNKSICKNCGTNISFINRPLWGLGKYKDGTEICYNCYIKKSKEQIEDKQYNKKNNKTPEFSHTYYNKLKDFAKSLIALSQKLQNDDSITKTFRKQNLNNISHNDFITQCIVYDMIKITDIIVQGNIKEKKLEAAGLILSSGTILSNNKNILFDCELHSIQKLYRKGELQELAEELMNIKTEPNPIGIEINQKQEHETNPKPLNTQLSFPAFLNISENPLSKEYATTLHSYATIIANANSTINETENQTIKDIYQLLNNPLNKENNSLKISENDTEESLDQVLEQLHSLIGLDEVKKEIDTLVNFIKIQKAREKSGLKSSPISYHIVFTGNPGTGKTTVARIIAKIYKHLGILSQGHLVETDRSGLVAEYTGQTAVKVNNTVNKAINGILFIDEAYSLVGENKDDFGKEAVATLIKRMEDDRDKLVIILAGYNNEMNKFIATNPGFKSRFNRYIYFPDYTPQQLLEIFEKKCQQTEYKLTEEAKEKIKIILTDKYNNRDQTFGNGRLVRNIFEKTLERQANRLAKQNNHTTEALTIITAEDV